MDWVLGLRRRVVHCSLIKIDGDSASERESCSVKNISFRME